MTRKVRGRKAERAARKALGIGTRITRHGAREEDYPVVPLEDVRVGDVVQFIGTSSRLAGFRLGTVANIHSRARMLRLESRLKLGGQEHVFFLADVHETRLLENLGPRKREVV